MTNTRDQILATASALIERQGYHATGLNEIVKESGAPKGSLYYYFPEGKDQIASEAVLQAGQTVSVRIRAGLAEIDNPLEAISVFIEKVAENVELSGFAAGSPLTAVATETAARGGRINLACREAYGLLIAAFKEKLLTTGMDALRAEELATFVVASIEGGILLSRTSHTVAPLRLVAKQLKLTLLQGIK